MEEQQKNSIRETVIEAAKSGKLKMKPKWHFALQAFLWAIGIIIAIMTLLYLASLFVFATRQTGVWEAPVFGWHGLYIFLTSLPWLMILLLIIFFVIVEILVRHFSFAYRWPLLYSGLAILFVVGVSGLLLEITPLHRTIMRCSPGTRPEPGNRVCGPVFYRELGPGRLTNIHRGTIIGIEPPDFTIENMHGDKLFIVVTSRTRLPYGSNFRIGNMVVVIGERRGDKVEAFGVSMPR